METTKTTTPGVETLCEEACFWTQQDSSGRGNCPGQISTWKISRIAQNNGSAYSMWSRQIQVAEWKENKILSHNDARLVTGVSQIIKADNSGESSTCALRPGRAVEEKSSSKKSQEQIQSTATINHHCSRAFHEEGTLDEFPRLRRRCLVANTEIRTRKAGITLAGGIPDIQAHPPR